MHAVSIFVAARVGAFSALFVCSNVFSQILLDWNQLAPAVVNEVNSFAALSDLQADALREIVKGRKLQALKIHVSDSARRRMAELIEELRTQGIDTDALLAHRDALMAQRKAASEAAVTTLEGQPIRLGGYLMPAIVQDGVVSEFLLVPWAGACSHMPTPPPNQSVRIRPSQPYSPKAAYDAVWVSGILQVRPQEVTVFVIDGEQLLRSSYAIDAAEVKMSP